MRKVKTFRKTGENEELGNRPATRIDLSTSFAFHTLTNQILVVANKNQRLYKSIKADISINKDVKHIFNVSTINEFKTPYTIKIEPAKRDGNPHGVNILRDK